MVQLVAWGNNAAGNLGIAGDGIFIHSPTQIRPSEGLEAVVWASWTCGIAKGSGGIHAAWGRSGLDNEQAALRLLEENRCVKIVGHEQPLAILTEDREVKPFNAAQPVRKGIKDMSIMGLGPVYALDERGIIRYQSFQDFVNDTAGTTVTHPAFDFTHPVSLYATESRLLVLFGGPLSHVFEVTEDPKGEITVLLVEDLEGVGVTSVVPGSANRFTLLTEAGDAYLISKGTIEPELLEIDDESPVRLMGLGSKFEVLVTEQSVWVRGDNKFSQLGLGGQQLNADEVFVKHPYFSEPSQISSLHCGRWSTIAVLQDA